eukprot:scaffold67732_cov45-Cyclotella_meneghiniana.AAC.2
MGFSLDQRKAVELFQRASELGLASAHFNLGTSYQSGGGVEQDRKKAIHHWQQAAMMGYEDARYNLGCMETESRNMGNSMRHHIISAKCGHDNSLKEVKMGFRAGIVTKDDFADTLRCHQASQDETKSEQRDRARATRVASLAFFTMVTEGKVYAKHCTPTPTQVTFATSCGKNSASSQQVINKE